MSQSSLRWSVVGFLFVGLLAAAPLRAQSEGYELLLRPNPPDQALDFGFSSLIAGSTHTQESDYDFKQTWIESRGRYIFDPQQPVGPRIGYSATWIGLESNAPTLPDHLLDVSASYGMAFGKWGPWFGAASIGAGYAGDSYFADSDAWYGKADLVFGRKLGDGYLVAVLDYDGNRTFMPDVPLPGIEYTATWKPGIEYVIGLPYSSVTWKPCDYFRLQGEAVLFQSFGARATLNVSKQLQVYSVYEDKMRAFHRDGDNEDRRLFFQQRRIEAGVRYEPMQRLAFSAGVGYAFSQEFTRGFDSRDQDGIEDIADAPYLRLLLEWRP